MREWHAWQESRRAWAEQQRAFFIQAMGDRCARAAYVFVVTGFVVLGVGVGAKGHSRPPSSFPAY